MMALKEDSNGLINLSVNIGECDMNQIMTGGNSTVTLTN